MTKLMFDRLQREKPSSYLKRIFLVEYNYTKGEGFLFAIYRARVWPCCISFKGDYSRCSRGTGNFWKFLSEFHFYMIAIYLRQINLRVTIKCYEYFNHSGLCSAVLILICIPLALTCEGTGGLPSDSLISTLIAIKIRSENHIDDERSKNALLQIKP